MGFTKIQEENIIKERDTASIRQTDLPPEEEKEKVTIDREWRWKWKNIIILSALHTAALAAYIYACLNDFSLKTVLFTLLIGMMSGLGTSAGSHRLWSHRAYKARWPLKVWLLIFQAITMNGSALSYARDHRTHHKHSDTEGDPKNPTRGLFYSHIGWWLIKKTEAVKNAGAKMDFSDLYNERLVWLQHKYYLPIFLFFGVLLPWAIPVYFWNEDPWIALGMSVILRITIVLHHLFTVNSLAHFFGYRPYDFSIRPADHRFVNYISFGEGIHNYHHVFAFDYRINDRPQWELFNPPGMFIELNRLLGLAYDCKIASPSVINGVIRRRGVVPRRDPPASLAFRIMNAIFDWVFGLLVDAWAAYPLIIFKMLTGRAIFV